MINRNEEMKIKRLLASAAAEAVKILESEFRGVKAYVVLVGDDSTNNCVAHAYSENWEAKLVSVLGTAISRIKSDRFVSYEEMKNGADPNV